MMHHSLHKPLPLSALWDQKAQKCGLKHTVYSATGNEYKGEWQDNRKHGKGAQVWKKSGAVYDGEWKCGKRDGFGVFSVVDAQTNEYKRKYFGEWKNGKKHGFGTFFFRDSSVFEGHWEDDSRCGSGTMYFSNGDVYDGDWRQDKRHGQGKMQYANGDWYEGSWRAGLKSGCGRFFYSAPGRLYDGFWSEGVAKYGTLSDFKREEAPRPSNYQIPQLELLDVQAVLCEAEMAFTDEDKAQSE